MKTALDGGRGTNYGGDPGPGVQEYNPYPQLNDPNAYQWEGRPATQDAFGQHPSGANADIDRLRAIGDSAENRQGVQIDNAGYNDARAQELTSRNAQNQVIGRYGGVINGTAPSVAAAQQNMGLSQGMGAALQQQAGARGPGGLAAAQSAAGGMAGNYGAQTMGQAAMGRAGETANAYGAQMGMEGQMRAADLQRAGMSADQAYRQAQIEAQQRAYNDKQLLSMEQLSNQVGSQQLGANMAAEQQNQAVASGNQQVQTDANRQNDQRADQREAAAADDASKMMMGAAMMA